MLLGLLAWMHAPSWCHMRACQELAVSKPGGTLQARTARMWIKLR